MPTSLQKSTVIRHGAFNSIPNLLRTALNIEIASGTKGTAMPLTGMDATPTNMNELFAITEANLENHDNILQDHENRLGNVESYESAAVDGKTIDSSTFDTADERMNIIQSAIRAARTELDNAHTYGAGNATTLETTTYDNIAKRLDTIQKAVVDEIANRGTAVTNEASARSTAITDEASARATAITNEATTRSNADTALAGRATSLESYVDTIINTDLPGLAGDIGGVAAALGDETTARTSAVSSEATARANADSALAASIIASQDTQPLYNGMLQVAPGGVIAGWQFSGTAGSHAGGYTGNMDINLGSSGVAKSPLIPVQGLDHGHLIQFFAWPTAFSSNAQLEVAVEFYGPNGTTLINTSVLQNSVNLGTAYGITPTNIVPWALKTPVDGTGTMRWARIKFTSSVAAVGIAGVRWDAPLQKYEYHFSTVSQQQCISSNGSGGGAFTMPAIDLPYVTNLDTIINLVGGLIGLTALSFGESYAGIQIDGSSILQQWVGSGTTGFIPMHLKGSHISTLGTAKKALSNPYVILLPGITTSGHSCEYLLPANSTVFVQFI